MTIQYHVALSDAEQGELQTLLRGQPVRRVKRAQILVAADAGASDSRIAASVGVGLSTVYRTKRRFVEGNLPHALSEQQRPGAPRKLSGKEEALLIATACSDPPEGRARWSCWPERSCGSPSMRSCPGKRFAGAWSRTT